MKAREIDPKIGAIEDAILAFMGTAYVNCNAGVSFDGAGQNFNITAEDTARNRWTYTEYLLGARVAVSPMGASLAAGATQQFTATATNADGTPVAGAAFDWSLTAGQNGSIDQNGLYTAPAAIAAATSDTVKCAQRGSQSWVAVVVNLAP